MSVPRIDLRDRTATGDLLAAYRDVGFAHVSGHGVPSDVIAAAFDAARRFHSQPDAAKRALALDDRHRGYIATGTSTDRASELGAAERPNQSESFMLMGDSPRSDIYLSGPDRWPDLPGFRGAITDYRAHVSRVARQLIDLFARGLGAERSLGSAFAPPTTWLRLLHYPERRTQDAEVFGSAPHVDFGAVTVLAQDDVGGLEVVSPHGAWIPVEPTPDAFVVNTGEMMRRWSGGLLRATPHRVVNPTGAERWSIAYFHDPGMHAVVEPLPGHENPAIEPVRFENYVRHQLESTYDRHATP